MNDLTFLPAVQMAEQIRHRKISPVELVEAHLRKIKKLNPVLNAFVQVDAEGAFRQAREAEVAVRRGAKLGALHGVPVSIKSSIEVAGFRCEAGTKLRQGTVASQDAPLVSRLRDAGAIILGTTNTPELLMAWETDNLLYGRTNNPWDLTRTPGGSSGGEAAAIASGMSAGGVGSDGGGSIRVPAHFSGICGLKPTPGRIPITGHWPESGGPFALLGVVGPMARSVEDLSLLFRVIAGFDAGDPMATPIPLRETSDEQLPKLTVGYLEEHATAPVTSETRAAVKAAVAALRDAGLRVEHFEPDVLNQAREHWWTLFVRLAAEMLAPEFKGRQHETSAILTYSDHPPTKEELLAAWFGRDQLRLRLMQQMNRAPVLICPVCSIPAFRHAEREWIISGKRISYMDAMSYTQWFNLLGNPAVVLPAGSSPEGLPIGVQIVGQPNSEELILKVAGVVEQALAPAKQSPMMTES